MALFTTALVSKAITRRKNATYGKYIGEHGTRVNGESGFSISIPTYGESGFLVSVPFYK